MRRERSCQSSSTQDNSTNDQLSRREFLKLSALSLGALIFPKNLPKITYDFESTYSARAENLDLLKDVPPSLMLHSKDLPLLQGLMPYLVEQFEPMTYETWGQRVKDLANGKSEIDFDYIFDRYDFLIYLEHFLENMLYRPNNYKPISRPPNESVNRLIPSNEKWPLIISIDDVGTGYLNGNFYAMFDILEKNSFPAVLGVQPLEEKNTRIWERLKELHEQGFEISSHTVNHYNMPSLPRDSSDSPSEYSLEYQIGVAADRIEDHIGKRPESLIFPFGNLSKEKPPYNPDTRDENIVEVCKKNNIDYLVGIYKGKTLEKTYPMYVGRLNPDAFVINGKHDIQATLWALNAWI